MAIPKYNEMYREFLSALKDGRAHSIKEVRVEIAEQFQLTGDELSEMLPSGSQRVFDNRVGWCKAYLLKAELIISPARAQVMITDSGKSLLQRKNVITEDDLMNSKNFAVFKNGKEENIEPAESGEVQEIHTPQEILDDAVVRLNAALASELLTKILEMDPYEFESLVVDLLIKMGYGKLQYGSAATRKSGDEGIDGVVTADKLGFDSIYLQAKRYKDGTVGRPDVQKFVGALAGQGAQKGIFITTSQFSKEALEFAKKNFADCKMKLHT